MSDATVSVKQKRRGRPPTGRDPLVGIRLPVETVAKVDEIAQADGSSRSVVIRQAIEREIKRRARKT